MDGDTVVLVHGLWMNGLELSMLGHRLRHDHGFNVRSFSYATMHGDAAETCQQLAGFADRACDDPSRLHFVAHSLGGVLVHRMLGECGGHFTAPSVVLGAPLNGSKAASGAAGWPMLRPLLGPLVLGEIATQRARHWSGPAALGSIAGTLRISTGQFFAHFGEDNDGTVAVSETLIPGLADHLVLPHSHFGMLLAADVAGQVAHFLRNGTFQRCRV
jgi:alpha-beta hydrolase superfamily lysophospholipase